VRHLLCKELICFKFIFIQFEQKTFFFNVSGSAFFAQTLMPNRKTKNFTSKYNNLQIKKISYSKRQYLTVKDNNLQFCRTSIDPGFRPPFPGSRKIRRKVIGRRCSETGPGSPDSGKQTVPSGRWNGDILKKKLKSF
jgi:hypothetical protein